MVYELDDEREPSVERRPGGQSARSWLLTVLGEYVLPTGGSAWTGALLDGLGALGVEEKAARQAIARSGERGWLAGERIGRRTRWALTDTATKLLREGTERIFGFGLGQPAWDGRWLLVLVSVPETRRDLRYRLRLRMAWAGFAGIGGGAWLTPWTDREEEAHRVLSELGVAGSARSFIGALGMMGDARALLAESWDLPVIEAQYEEFVARWKAAPAAGSDADAFVAVTRLVHEWRRFPVIDPNLPRSLLPAQWKGHEAAEVFARLHDALSPAARRWWAGRAATS